MDPLYNVDISKLDFDVDIKDLSREIVFTLKVLDDDTFKIIAAEANKFISELKAALKTPD